MSEKDDIESLFNITEYLSTKVDDLEKRVEELENTLGRGKLFRGRGDD